MPLTVTRPVVVMPPPARAAVPGSPASGVGAPPVSVLAKKAKALVEQRMDLRRRMHDFTAQLLRPRDLDLASVRAVVANVLAGTRDAMTGMNTDDRSQVLRQVFEGMTDALAGLAEGMQCGIDHAGKQLCPAGLNEMMIKLRGLEGSFLDACALVSDGFADPARKELKGLVAQARVGGTKIAPAGRSTMEVLDQRLLEATRSVRGSARAGKVIRKKG